ncbi:hypothetical protein BASA83_007165 [Batrachochytrium salamandrivorans]|nr:hypothetical protein BASA83_007165 [Batrachochytrium salamandrivorans]
MVERMHAMIGDMVKLKNHTKTSSNSTGKAHTTLFDVGYPENVLDNGTVWTRFDSTKTKPFNKEFAPKIYVNPKPHSPTSSTAPAGHFRGFINQLELVFQSRDKRYDTDRKKIATLGTLLTDKALSGTTLISNSRNGMPTIIFMMSAFKARMKATFGEIKTKSKYPRPSSGLSDKWFKFRNQRSSSLRITGIAGCCYGPSNSDRQQDFERKQEQQYNPRSFRRNPPQLNLFLESNLSSTSATICLQLQSSAIQQPSAPTTATPVQPRLTSNDMDIDLHVVVLSLLLNDNRGLVKDFALFVDSRAI